MPNYNVFIYCLTLKIEKQMRTNRNSNRPSSYQKLTYIQKVSRINRKLRQGDISRVAESTGYSNTHVSDVIAGNEFNSTIVNRAYDMTRGRKANPQVIASL